MNENQNKSTRRIPNKSGITSFVLSCIGLLFLPAGFSPNDKEIVVVFLGLLFTLPALILGFIAYFRVHDRFLSPDETRRPPFLHQCPWLPGLIAGALTAFFVVAFFSY
jgi:hypothetical protein